MSTDELNKQQEVRPADLRQLVDALGLGDYARSGSPEHVFAECIRHIKEMMAERDETIERCAKLAEANAAEWKRGAETMFGTFYGRDLQSMSIAGSRIARSIRSLKETNNDPR